MFKQTDVYQRLLGYLKPYWKQVLLAYLSMLLATLLNLSVPQIIKGAIDQGLAAGQPITLFIASGLILAIALVRGGVGFGQRYFGEWLSHRASYDLRNHFYNSVQNLPFTFHDQAQTGDLMSRATGDITETERFVGIGLMDLTATMLLLGGVVVAMLLENAAVAALSLIPIIVLILAAIRFGGIVRPMFKDLQEHMGVLSNTMQESMTGINVVKAFAREPYELQKFDRDNDTWFQKRRRIIMVWANNWPFFTFTLAVSTFFLLWFGGPRVMAGQITIGSFFALISYILMLNGPAQRLGFLVNLAATAGASASRVFEIIDIPSETIEHPAAHPLDTVRGEVTFEGIGFAYPNNRPVLHDINFTVEPGQMIALIGPTGSGKSTIINLIPRFYTPTAGRILIDSIDIERTTRPSLRRHIGIVLQDPFLFSATI
ncbi:ABC transporter ATP-binding protein, partial [Chloroflexota bacterium]